MPLYIMVRHRADRRPHCFAARWQDDQRLLGITTTDKVARLLEESRSRGESVFVHRSASGRRRDRIVCEVEVASVAWIPGRDPEVTFGVRRLLDVAPRPALRRWQLHYHEPAPQAESAPVRETALSC